MFIYEYKAKFPQNVFIICSDPVFSEDVDYFVWNHVILYFLIYECFGCMELQCIENNNNKKNIYTVVAKIVRTLGTFRRFQVFLLDWPLQYP